MAEQPEYIGTYKILEKIGEGGMANIYKALQPSLKRTVVIKKLKDPNREIIKRFKKEALLSASFHHQNLVAIYDFIYSNRSYYLIMEHVDGEDLRTIIDHLTPIPPQIAALIALSIARGLEYTHSRNIIHRDIKPSNVLIGYDGSVKLIDFGIARDDLSTRLTMTGMIVGTPAYMSPEQADGENLTPKSDLFSLGILIYEMLTGVKPFDGSKQSEVITRIIRGNYVPLGRINPAIPFRLKRIIKKCLQHSPQKRYHSATQLINDLERFLPWQVRNQKKRIMARFLNELDKNQPSSVQTVIPELMKRFSNGRWLAIKSLTALTALLSAVLLFFYLQHKHIGYADISTKPGSYRLTIDRRKVLTANGPTIRLPAMLQGNHTANLQNVESNARIQMNFGVNPNRWVHIRVPDQTEIKRSMVRIFTQPEAALIYVDHDSAGLSPFMSDSLTAGWHDVRIEKAGFKPLQTRIRCYPEQWQRYLFVLDTE